ncbi:MAG: amidohydrolase family protein, partial [Actinomycetota bacterium]
AGSTLTMDRAFRFVVDAGVPMADAVAMTATTPARLLGRADRVGSLQAGLDADLVVLDDACMPIGVMHKGAWID